MSAVILLSGCASLPFGPHKKVELPTATDEEPAVETVCIWQPAYGKGLNGLPTRGIAGQLMFFTARNPSPVVVEGDLRVYLFDDQGQPEERAKPIHIFDVPAERWPAHLEQSSLGPAYQVFVPYVRGGHNEVTCSLQVRFTPKAGPRVYSRIASVTLPGTSVQETPAASESDVSQAAYLPQSSAQLDGNQLPETTVRSINTRDLIRKATASSGATRVSPTTEIRAEEDSGAVAERLERLEQVVRQLVQQQSHAESQADRAVWSAVRGSPDPAQQQSHAESQAARAGYNVTRSASVREAAAPRRGTIESLAQRRRFRLTPAEHPFPSGPSTSGEFHAYRSVPSHPLMR